MPQHLVVARFLHVQDLAFERQNRLIAPVAARFRGPACRFALYQEQLATFWVLLLAIRQLAWQSARVHGALATRKIAGLSRRFARPRRIDGLRHDLPHHCRILVEVLAQFFVDKLNDETLNVAVQFAFGLPFKLRLGQFHAHNRRQTFAHVIARQVLFDVLEQPGLLPISIDGARQCAAEAAQMRCRRPRY